MADSGGADEIDDLLSCQDPILPDIPECSNMWNITHEEYLILSKALEIRIRESKIDPDMASDISYYIQMDLLRSRKDWHVRDHKSVDPKNYVLGLIIGAIGGFASAVLFYFLSLSMRGFLGI